jgi:hypothetical protein
MSTGSDPEQIRALLATARGYAVFDREGTRMGAFIELAGAPSDRIAIRQEGFFVWRRRLLPITTVAKVVPDKRAVVLTVEGRSFAGSGTPSASVPGTSGIAEEDPRSNGDWRDRLERYVGPVEAQPAHADLSRGAEHEAPPNADEGGHPVTPAADQPEPDRRDQRTADRHLLFVSTSGGYSLVEREGPPPSVGHSIELPEQPVSFLVTKLGPSPLPNDPRICAYLDPIE